MHRRLFVTPGESQFITVANAEAGMKAAAKDEGGKLRERGQGVKVKARGGDVGQAGQGQGQGKENGVLVEFGEG